MKMTMTNKDQVPNITYSDVKTNMFQFHRYLPDVVQCSENSMTSYNTDYGRCVMEETAGHITGNMKYLESTPHFVHHGNMYGEQSNKEIGSLCDQLGSVEMVDDLSRECFNELQTSERNHDDNIAATVDASRIYLKDIDGDTLLHNAIILHEVTLAMLFIGKAPSYTWLSFTNMLFQTPLHLSVLTNQPDITRRLIVAGSEVDIRDKDGNTALHIACRQGQHRNVQNLLESVRYHETKQNSYEIPYQAIPQDLSIKNYNGLTCLHLAASNGHLHVLNELLNKDIDVNLKEGKTGRTILHNACLTGDTNLVKLLLRHRSCNINAKAFDENTPFDLARFRGHEDICIVLAAAGAGYSEDFDSD